MADGKQSPADVRAVKARNKTLSPIIITDLPLLELKMGYFPHSSSILVQKIQTGIYNLLVNPDGSLLKQIAFTHKI